MKRLTTRLVLGVILAIGARRAHAEETDPHPVGVGYKIGNGIGFVGADLVLRLVPHVVFDLQANYVSLTEPVYGGAAKRSPGTGWRRWCSFSSNRSATRPIWASGWSTSTSR